MKPKHELKGRIIAMYGTITKFAKHVNMSYRKVSFILNGKQEATASDIEVFCGALNVDIPDDMLSLFFV